MLRAINFVTGQVDRQIPYQKFMQGEVHSETLAIPIVLLAVAVALNLWRAPDNADPLSWRTTRWLVPCGAFVLGAVTVTQAWYAPAFYLVIVVAFALRGYAVERRLSRALLVRTGVVSLLLPPAAVLLYLPFFRTDFSTFDGLRVEGELASRPHHLLYMWLPMFWLTGSFALVSLIGYRPRPRVLIAAAALPLAVLGGWLILMIAGEGTMSLADAIENRLSDGYWLSLLILVGLLVAAYLACLRELAAAPGGEGLRPSAFALSLATIAVLLILGVEFFSVNDSAVPRFNTLIKANYIAWFLLSISGAFGVYYVLTHLKTLAVRAAWVGVTAAILAAGLVYPVLTTASYTATFQTERHLNLLWKWQRYAPGEYAAVLWLRDNVEGTPTIVEAVGDSYSSYARVSTYTGLPALLGWPAHEQHWRGGSLEPQAGRREAVERIYKTTDANEAKALLEQYGVEYVYVGGLERQTYGEEGMGKFGSFMDVAFQNQDVTIYRMREAGGQVRQG
jgi:YYY domain-containing protein